MLDGMLRSERETSLVDRARKIRGRLLPSSLSTDMHLGPLVALHPDELVPIDGWRIGFPYILTQWVVTQR